MVENHEHLIQYSPIHNHLPPWPEDRERLVIRGMESCLNGRSVEEQIGESGGHVGW